MTTLASSSPSTPIGVLLTRPLSDYLQNEISNRFSLFKLWQVPPESRRQFLDQHSDRIHAIISNGVSGATTDLIDSLPRLQIISNHGSGLDKIDLDKCRTRGIRVTYTPHTLTNEVADMAILLALATARRICAADRYLRSGEWKKSDFQLTIKVYINIIIMSSLLLLILFFPSC